MTSPKLTGKPPSKDDFIEGDSGQEQKSDTGNYAWNDPSVRDDVTKVFNLRLSEATKLKLDFIGKANRSAHQFCLDVLIPAIDDEIERLTKGH
ncbi:MAG: hypothetical protein AAF292_11105 [Pseudomonadota bacterium]